MTIKTEINEPLEAISQRFTIDTIKYELVMTFENSLLKNVMLSDIVNDEYGFIVFINHDGRQPLNIRQRLEMLHEENHIIFIEEYLLSIETIITNFVKAAVRKRSSETFEQQVENQLVEIRRFIEEILTTGKYRDQEEFWATFSDEIDICFSEDDDPASPFHGTMNFYAYPLITDGDGRVSTGTDEFVKVSLN
jgi:hypothetical protein